MNSIRVLQFIAFMDLFAIGMLVPLLPAHARKLGGNHIHIGLLGSVYATFQLFSGPVIGSLSDLKGRKIILIMTLLVSSITYILSGLCSSVLGLICLRAVTGVFKQTQILTRAMVAEFEPVLPKQSKAYGQMAAIAGMGITLGPLVSGHLMEWYPENGFKYVSVAVGVFFILNAGTVHYFLFPPTKVILKRKIRSKSQNSECACGCAKCQCSQPLQKDLVSKVLPQSYLKYILLSIKESVSQLLLIEWSIYWDVFILKGLIGFALGVYYSNYPTYLGSVYQLSPKYIGYVVSFQGVVTSIASFLMGSINSLYKSDKDFTLRIVHVFVFSSLSLFGLIISYDVYWYLFWLTPLAISNGVGRQVTLDVILMRSKGAHRGSLIGAANSVRSLAGIISPMTAGFICHYIGVNYCIHASLLSTVLGLCLSYYCRVRSKKIKIE